MNLPTCPNVRDGACERSELRMAGEDEHSWFFVCRELQFVLEGF